MRNHASDDDSYITPKSDDLLPCPICGSEPVVRHPVTDRPIWRVHCSKDQCYLYHAYGTGYKEMTSRWNDESRRHDIRIAGEMRDLDTMSEEHMVYNLEHMTVVEDREDPYVYAAMMALELLRRHGGHEEFIETYGDLFDFGPRLDSIKWMFQTDQHGNRIPGTDGCTFTDDENGERSIPAMEMTDHIRK